MSALPKPLSQKSIEKMLSEYKPETADKLHRFYAACANLYGAIELVSAWKICRQVEPKIHKKEFMSFSSVARRENLPYYVLEIDEVYSDEARRDEERIIADKRLILDGYGKFRRIYDLADEQIDKPYFIPKDFYTVAEQPMYDQKLRKTVKDLKVTEGKHKGKKLFEIIALNKIEQFDLEYFKSESKKAKIKEAANIPTSDKIMNSLFIYVNLAHFDIQYVSKLFEDEGVVWESKAVLETFLNSLMEYQNKSHLWCNSGWSPEELSAKFPPAMLKSISFGPGLQKAFAKGDLDREEIEKKLREMGIEIEK